MWPSKERLKKALKGTSPGNVINFADFPQFDHICECASYHHRLVHALERNSSSAFRQSKEQLLNDARLLQRKYSSHQLAQSYQTRIATMLAAAEEQMSEMNKKKKKRKDLTKESRSTASSNDDSSSGGSAERARAMAQELMREVRQAMTDLNETVDKELKNRCQMVSSDISSSTT